MVVEVHQLTPDLLEKLAKIPDQCREKGPAGNPNDPTRLCNSWKGAALADKKMLDTLLTDNPESGPGGITAATLKRDCACFRIYTNDILHASIGNWRKQYKKRVER